MRLLLAGGGTGGHLFPAVALAQLLLQQEPGAAVQFVGTQKGLEARLLPKLGLPLVTVDMTGVVGRGWRGKLELGPKLVKSLWQAKSILKKFAPDLVLGVGGYASVPVLLMAKFLGIPYVIHEQNAIPGVSNRLLGKGAELICLSFPSRPSGFNPKKTLVTGNPLRSAMAHVEPQVPDPGKLLIFGGSRGARAINQVAVEMLPLLQKWPQPPVILHQTGEDDLVQVRADYAAAGWDPHQVVPFIEDMATAYAQARLVVCRAGATTLAELTVCGRPAILIPFPFATGDHQTANARTLANAGAALLLPQREMNADRLADMLNSLWKAPDRLKLMAERGRALGNPGAAETILNECRRLLDAPMLKAG